MESPILSIVIMVIIVIVACILVGLYKRRSTKFKNEVISKVIQETFPNANYKPDEHISKEEYDEIGALRRGTHFHGGDLLEGKTQKGTNFRYNEIYTYNKVHTDKSDTNVTVFRGGIFSFQYPKNISSPVVLCTNKIGTKKSLRKKFKQKKFETENAEFNDTFYMYTENLETAFYILTPQIMEKLINLSRSEKKGIIISLKDNWIHIAVPNLDIFKTPVFGVKNPVKIKLYQEKTKNDINKFTNIIDSLDLDNHIFTSN